MNVRRILSALFIMVSFAAYCPAQVATGVLPFNSYGGGPFDSVNLGNLNAHFSIPVLHKAGRGGPFAYDLSYDSSIYRPVVSNGTSSWQPVTTIGNIDSYWGWQALGPVLSPYVAYKVTYSSGNCGQYSTGTYQEWVFGGFIYYDGNGTAHALSAGGSYFNSTGGSSCPPNGAQPSGVETVRAQDGSGYVINVSFEAGYASGDMQSEDGTTLSVPFLTSPPSGSSPYTATDKNGNFTSFNSSNGTYTDTLGQPVLVAAGAEPNPVTFSYIPPANEGSGTRVSVTVNFVKYTVQTNFNAKDGSGHAIAEYKATSSVALVDHITLPDGTQYQFQYEPTPSTPSSGACTPIAGTTCVTGRILKVTLPTGGTITYGYTGGANGIINDGSPAGLTRTLSSPGGEWQYVRNQVSGAHWQTTVTSPIGDKTVLDFMEDGSTGNAATYSFYETNRQVNQLISGVQTPLVTTTTCWNGNASACATTAVSSPITERTATLQYPGGLQSKTDSTYNGGSTGSGLVSQINQYAYSTGTPTTLLRQTVFFYGSWNGSSCSGLSNNITDVPCDVTVYDTYNGTSYGVSKTRYTYDEYSPQATTGTPQHSSVTGSRGNATTIQTALSWNSNNGVVGSSLTKHFKYYDTGTVYQSEDVNGQWTTYNYSTAAQGNSTASCGNSFPTSYILPISGLSSSASTAYDCIGGVVTGQTDLNGNTTTTSYSDPYFWRPASVVAPYTNTSTTTTSSTYSPTSVDTKMLLNGGASVAEALTTVGTFGQTLYSQQHEGPSSTNWDTTQAGYDSLLRQYQSTMPCVTSSGSGCTNAAITTSSFDALGRVTQTTDGGNPTPGWVKYTYTENDVLQENGPAPSGENTKQRQLEYDAIGRLISICEKSPGLPGTGVCSQQTSQPNGYFTTYTYGATTVNSVVYTTVTVTQNAQASTGKQTRVYTYDLAGRLVSEQNPETANLATTYVYDSDSSGVCTGTYAGDLVRLTDAKGNNICYQYDAIHRKTQITYPSGPDSGNTPTKTFVYDSATFTGAAMSNPKGRLVEAYTGSSSSKTTDEFFQYSVRGELTDTWQCTPHSGTNGCASTSNYYHVSASFWANGAVNSLSSNISGLPTQTYGVDPMGRTSTVSASSGQNPVTSTSYNLSTFTYSVTFGSGDSDTFYLDPYTGRQTKYMFNVNGATDTGQTTWNPNSSLQTLQITDNVPGTSDTQTCSYIHDDLARIASVSCVNGSTKKWNQQFTYDAFGNITKNSSGPGGVFQPTYSSSTNWITALPGCTPTTDNNGQMTYDCAHNYTWDSEGKLHTVDTTTLTHDALGRTVEKAVGSTYAQFVYGPAGNKFATMNAQTLVQAFVPLPVAIAVYTPSGLAYYRHTDHLGSSHLATTTSRGMYSSTAYSPHGEPYAQAGTTDVSFTGQGADTTPVTTNGTTPAMYDFLFRKYSPAEGRWLSPDPAGLAAANPANPQSWNRYAYASNNPMAIIDPLGLDDCNLNGADVDGDVNCVYDMGYTISTQSQPGCPNNSCAPDTPEIYNASLGIDDSFIVIGVVPGGAAGGGGPVVQAELSALRAMLTNTECAALIGGKSPSGQANIVKDIAGQLLGNPNQFIRFNAGPDPAIGATSYATTTPGYFGVSVAGLPSALEWGATITLGPTFYNPPASALGPGVGPAQIQEGVILEEYGHAEGYINALPGDYAYPGATGIMFDNSTNLRAVSVQNGQNVQSTCINQPGNVPIQNAEWNGLVQ